MNIWRSAASAWPNNTQKAKDRKHKQIFNLIDVYSSKNDMYVSTIYHRIQLIISL